MPLSDRVKIRGRLIMSTQPQSPEALKLKCDLLEIQNQILSRKLQCAQEAVTAQQKAQEHFWEWISHPVNYKQWLRDKYLKISA